MGLGLGDGVVDSGIFGWKILSEIEKSNALLMNPN